MLTHANEIPSPQEAARAIRMTFERAIQAGIPRDRLAWDGLPHCYLPEWRDRFDDLFTNDIVALREADEGFFPMVDYRNMTRTPGCHGCLIGDECRGVYGRLWDFFPDALVYPIHGGLSNSFNFEPSMLEDVAQIIDGCPARKAFDQGDAKPLLRRLFLEEGKLLKPMVTDTGDFSERDIGEIVHDLGQVYLDQDWAVLVSDFSAQLGCLKRKQWCNECPYLSCCGGAHTKVETDFFAQAEARVVELLSQLSGHVLDVGCGTGFYGDLIENKLIAGEVSRYVAVDPQPGPSVKALQSRHAQVEVLDSTMEALELPEGGFDWVLVLRSHNHFGDLWESYFRMVRALKPGGRLLVVDNTAFALIRENKETMEELRALDGVEPEHIRNHTGIQAQEFISRFPLTLIDQYDVGPGSANQWLRLYRFHGWLTKGSGGDDV
jgi:SAM-dependent methyltransferase